jgi:hypothetical protein
MTVFFKWSQRYLDTKYPIVRLVKVISDGNYQTYWDSDLKINKPLSELNVYGLKRKED